MKAFPSPVPLRKVLEVVEVDTHYGELQVLRKVNLHLFEGEVVALFGPNGHGKSTLLKAICGIHLPSNGCVSYCDEKITGLPTKKIVEMGIAYIPEERNRDGMIQEFTVAENLIMRDTDETPYSKRGVFNFKAIDEQSKKLVGQFNVKTPSVDTPMKNLSGGNAQKVSVNRLS